MPSADAPRPTVSVEMAVYNGERYLEEALQSILAQTFDDFEDLATGHLLLLRRSLSAEVQDPGTAWIPRQRVDRQDGLRNLRLQLLSLRSYLSPPNVVCRCSAMSSRLLDMAPRMCLEVQQGERVRVLRLQP